MTYQRFEGKNRGAVMRKVVGAAIALGAMVAAAASQPGIEQARREAVDAGVRRAAADTGARLGASIDAFLTWIADRGQNAASLPQLRPLLGLVGPEGVQGEVGATLRDFFHVEKDWERWRNEFPVNGISIEGTRADLLVGAPLRSFSAGPLITRARNGNPAAGFVLANEVPHALVAARLSVPGRDVAPVLLLARPLDDGMLATLGKRAGLTLLLSDGKQPLARQGQSQDLERLARAIGKEGGGEVFSGEGGTWAAAVRGVTPGFWLLALTDPSEATHQANGTARNTRVIVWSAGGLIALLGLFMGFRRAGTAPAALRVPATDPNITTRLGPRSPSDRAPLIEETTPTPLVTALPSATPAAGTATAGSSAPPTTSERDVGPTSLASATAVATLRPFGRYILLNQLGEGGMARVYTAVVLGAEGFRRKFVIKRLRPELIEDASVVAQFIDEANMASSLVHSNIVPVLDFGKVDDEYFLATEYILGRDLARLTTRAVETTAHGLPPDAVLFVALEVLKALEYAHAKTAENGLPLGLVHRDVSPSNVLVSARGEVKLFDFGIVKAEGRVTRTQHGVVKGNVSFMSPEQARSTDVDGRADLFSLGLVLYACLTGQMLYGGNTTYELLVKAANGPGPEEVARLRALPSPLGALLEKVLAVDPGGRFQNAAEFAAAVAPHVGSGGSTLAELVTRLFAEDFRKEEAAFASATPPPPLTGGLRVGGLPGSS